MSYIRSVTWMLVFLALPTQAATLQYVRDEVAVELRTGQGHTDPVVRNLTPGTRVSLLRSTADGHSRVRLKDGTEGWVLSHLLVKNAVPAPRLLELRAKQDKLAAENQRERQEQLALREALAERQSRLTAAKATHQELLSTIARLRDLIPHSQALEDQHQSMLSQLVRLESSLDLLRVENNARRDEANQNWAIVGIGVLIGGALGSLLLNRTLS